MNSGLVSSVSLAPSETLRTLSIPASEASDGGYTVRLRAISFKLHSGAPSVPVSFEETGGALLSARWNGLLIIMLAFR